jgi:hypothetical protein
MQRSQELWIPWDRVFIPIGGKNIHMQDLRLSRWWLWRMASSRMLHRVALVRTDVSEELSASFIRVTRVGELGTKLAVTSNRRRLFVFLRSVRRLLVTASVVPSSPILSPWWRRRYVPPKRRFLQEPQGVTSQNTPFFKNIHDCKIPVYQEKSADQEIPQAYNSPRCQKIHFLVMSYGSDHNDADDDCYSKW